MLTENPERFCYVVIFQCPDYMAEGTYVSTVSLEINDKHEAINIAKKEINYLINNGKVSYTYDVDDFLLVAIVEVDWEAREVDIFNVF